MKYNMPHDPTLELICRNGRAALQSRDENQRVFGIVFKKAKDWYEKTKKLLTDEQAWAEFRRVGGRDEERFLSEWHEATRPSDDDERYVACDRDELPDEFRAADNVFVDGKFVRRREDGVLEYQDPTTLEWSVVPAESGPFHVKTDQAYEDGAVTSFVHRPGLFPAARSSTITPRLKEIMADPVLHKYGIGLKYGRAKEGVWTREDGSRGSIEYENPRTGEWSRTPESGVTYAGKKEDDDDEDDSWNARDFIRNREMAWPEDEDMATKRIDEQTWGQRQARNESKPKAWRARPTLKFTELGAA